jgi:hypothetical protein
VVLVAGLTAFLVLTVSAAGGVPAALPGIALGSPALLHVERALLVGASVAAGGIFVIRGWAGYFPSKLSTNGAEYGDWTRVDDVSGSSEDVREEVADLWAHQLAIARMMQAVRDDLAREVGSLDVRNAHRTAPSDQEDML